MKLAIDVRSLMDGRLTGVEIYTTEIIRAMLKVAPEHEYHLFYNSYQAVTLPDFGPKAIMHGFAWPNKLLNMSQLLWQRPRWDVLLPIKPDCFFVPNVRLMPVSLDIPVVVTAHDLSFERFPEFFSLRRRMWHRLMQPRQLMYNADHIITDSAATARDVELLYNVPTQNITVVYPGVSSAYGLTAISAARKKYQLPAKFVLYLGAFEPRKNIPSIIKAFSAIAHVVDHDLVLAGSPGWLMGSIDQALKESSVRHRIHNIGFVAEADKQALYAAADLFVYPSFYEGFGFPPLEALLAGTPVITSMNSSLPEVVGQWATLVNPYEPSELAVVMRELLENPIPVPPIVRQEITQRFSWEKAARQILAVIESAA